MSESESYVQERYSDVVPVHVGLVNAMPPKTLFHIIFRRPLFLDPLRASGLVSSISGLGFEGCRLYP